MQIITRINGIDAENQENEGRQLEIEKCGEYLLLTVLVIDGVEATIMVDKETLLSAINTVK